MAVFLDGLSIKFFRGIGPKTQKIAKFSDLNFFIGANNSGKSIVLECIHSRLPFSSPSKNTVLQEKNAEAYRGKETGDLEAMIGIGTDCILEGILKTVNVSNFRDLDEVKIKNMLIAFCTEISEQGVVWLKKNEQSSKPTVVAKANPNQQLGKFNNWEWNELVRGLVGLNLRQDIEQVFSRLQTIAGDCQYPSFPESKLIPAKRQLGQKNEAFDDLSGKGLIDELAQLQNPDHDELGRKDNFDKINKFLQTVLDKPEATIQVPHDRNHILIKADGKVLPLQNLGTGIHEIILIAAFCTIHQGHIICIEEPEIHLHPLLQKKLINYLSENTDNQYFIATHSSSFIDTPNASVFRVENDGVQTYVSPALLREEKREICNDLGYRASDILQANAVIWVEGPSDRIYLNHWLSSMDSSLIEGVHYSIMFYGGRLLSHLTAEAELVADLINLKSLNKNTVVIIDSDKDAPRKRLNATKARLVEELDGINSFAWVTAGREIENYIDHATLQDAVKAVHSKIYEKGSKGDQFDHALFFERLKPSKPSEKIYKLANKVKVAEKVCEDVADLSVLDLKKQITRLVDFIQRSN